ncbi:MAG: PEP-CTERM sorting domain-containing protein [Casimicrobiaceae bacterium]
MPNNKLRVLLGFAVAAAAAMSGGAANAGHYGTSYDPNFFSGVAVFFVPDPPSPCLGLGAGVHAVNGEGDTCQDVAVTSISATAKTEDMLHTAHLTFSGSDVDDITGMVLGFEEPLLQGINSRLIPVDCSGDNVLCDDTDWFIQFDSGLRPPAPLASFVHAEFVNPLAGLFNQVFLYSGCSDDCTPQQFAVANTNVTFTQVPEPGTVALILGGLAAGWLTRKRKAAV